MVERRRAARIHKRIKVRFGETEFTHSGFSIDVSPFGMFIATGTTPAIGTRLHIELTLEGNQLMYAEGIVMRTLHVPPELRQVQKAGFGVRFLTPTEVLGEMVPTLRNNSYIEVSFASPQVLANAYNQEIKQGALLVQTHKEYPVNSTAALELHLPFLRAHFELEARVVSSVRKLPGRFDTTLVLSDLKVLKSTLEALLGASPPA